MPTVSVIVPNYCHAPYLEQRIESILQQTFQDFELILLDDCSTDGSREILERYRNHPKVSGIFYNERNSGSPFKQWKKGLSKATGDYVWIAESDDFSSPCFLERCVRILDTRPDCSIVFTSSYIVDSHSRTIREEAPVKYPKHKQIRFGSRFFLYRFLCPRNTIYNAGMALVRRSALPADDNYTQYRYCGDWLFDFFRPSHVRQRQKTVNFKREARRIQREQANKPYHYKCAVCGRTDTDYPELEFRYCSRCVGYHCFCQDHINNHVHFTE